MRKPTPVEVERDRLIKQIEDMRLELEAERSSKREWKEYAEQIERATGADLRKIDELTDALDVLKKENEELKGKIR